MKRLIIWLNRIISKHKALARWQRIVTVMAAVITFATTYALILPAITVERDKTDEIGGMYLEGKADTDDMLEENALEPMSGDIFADDVGDEAGTVETDAPAVRILKAIGDDYTVTLTCDATSGIPDGSALIASEIAEDSEEYQIYLEETKKAMGLKEEETLPRFAARFFEIKIMLGDEEIKPDTGVSVEITYAEPLAENPYTTVSAVHFAGEPDEAEILEANITEVQDDGEATVGFMAETFSVYGVIYTVDYHWEVDGEAYDFSIPGGGFVSLRQLVEMLDIVKTQGYVETTGGDEGEEIRTFVAEVEKVRFSSPDLVWVGKTDEDITVGELKEANGLTVQYSTELTDEQIADINAQTVEAGDWALISMHPFSSKETLTVTMKTGEVFVIRVTDNQIRENVLTADGQTYEGLALAAPPTPEKSESATPVNLDDETLDKFVRASLSRSGLLRAEETESPESENTNTEVGKPDASKTLVANEDKDGAEDGTYTLTLSVKGHSDVSADETQKKANVLLVMDRSSSMITKKVNEPGTYRWYYGTRENSSWRGDLTENNGYYFKGLIDGQEYDLNVCYSDWFYDTHENRPIQVGGSYYNPVVFYDNGSAWVTVPDDAPIFVESGKTRMMAEQEALSTLVSQLLGKNDASGEDRDVVEVRVISFGDERFDDKDWKNETEVGWQSGRNTAALMNGILSNRYTSGTNWEEALQYAYAEIKAKKDAEVEAGKDEDYYVIFLTDGEPTAVEGEEGQAWHTGSGANGNIYAYNAAKDEGKLLAGVGEFYNIFTFRTDENDIYSKYLTNYAYGYDNLYSGDTPELDKYYDDARTVKALNDKFNEIFFAISDALGHGNVSITDTLTTDAMTTTVVHGKANGYVYEVKDESDKVIYTVTATGDLNDPHVVFNVPGSSTTEYVAKASTVGDKTVYSVRTNEGKVYKMALADVDDTTGELVWDLSPVGILMNNCTYSVSFVVWPDQDAYDYVAALNNGIKKIKDSDGNTVDVEWDPSAAEQVGNYFKGGSSKYKSIVYYPGPNDDIPNGIYTGRFAVLTNSDQKLHYSILETKTNGTETETTITGPYYRDLETPDPMPLTSSSSQLEKLWNVERDPGILAQLLYDTKGKPTEFKIEFDILQDDDGTTGNEGDETGGEGGETGGEGGETGGEGGETGGEGGETGGEGGETGGEGGETGGEGGETGGEGGETGGEGTGDEEPANLYKEITIGWDETANNGQGAYAWDPDTEQTVTYHDNECVVGTRWAADFSIATGLMLSEARMDDIGLDKTAYPSGKIDGVTYYILEEGHDYTISEPGLTFEFDFEAPTYHPMLVDGVLKSVNFTINEEQEDNRNKVTFEKVTALDIEQGISSLRIVNTLRGYINLDKVVVGTDGKTPVKDDNTKFEYTVILENSTNPGPFTHDGSHIPWYGINDLYYHTEDEDGTFHYYQVTPLEEGQVRVKDEDSNTFIGYCDNFEEVVGPQEVTLEDGTVLELHGNQMEWTNNNYVYAVMQITSKETLNIANVPVGTQYTITEADQDETKYELVKIEREIRVTPESDPESSETVTGTNEISGTIVANRDNHVIYTNKSTTTSIAVEKTWDTPAGMPTGTADIVLYSIVGKKPEDLAEGEIDPAKPSDKIRVTVDAALISDHTGEPVGVSRDAYIDIEYTGSGTGTYRLDNENGWQHTFEFDRGGTYNFTFTSESPKIIAISPEEKNSVDTTMTIPLTATVEHVPQYEYRFTVPNSERNNQGGIVVTCNGEEKTAGPDNDWTVEFSVANGASVTYSARPANGFVSTVRLEPEAVEGEVAASSKTVKMHPQYAETSINVPVNVNWDKTPPTGTAVTVNFIPDKEGVDAQSVALNGSEGWQSSKELPRLDADGEMITWTVTTTAVPADGYTAAVSLESPQGATICDTASDVIVNGTTAITTMTVPVSVDWGTVAPDPGTTVTVTFTNGTATETITLNGNESTPWTAEKTLPRLDEDGDLLTWSVSTEVTPSDGGASVSGAPETVGDPDGDGVASEVALSGTVRRIMNLTVKAVGRDFTGVNIRGIYKATIVNGVVYYETADQVSELSGWKNDLTTTIEGLDVKDPDGNDQYYVIALYNNNVDTKTDLSTAGYTTIAREDSFTFRTVVYFKAETGNRTIELTSSNSANGRVQTGQTMNSAGSNAAYSASGRKMLKAKPRPAPLRASNPGSPVQTFYDNSIVEGTPAFTVIQFKDLPEGATPVVADGNGKEGTQTVTGNETCTWSNLPNQDENGNPIYYYVVEKSATAQADTMSVKYEYVYNDDGTIAKVVITNTTTGTPTPKTGDITVTKSFVGVSADEIPDGFKITNDYDGQEFTLANATGTNPYTWTLSGIDEDTVVKFTESGATVNGYNLTVTSGGRIVAGSAVTATVVAESTVTAEFVNTYEPKTTNITLNKVDKDDLNKVDPELLKGAAFTLSKYKDDTFQEKDADWGTEGSKILRDTKISDESYTLNGVFTFEDLTVGYYKLEETDCPPGYVRLSDSPTFKIEANDSNELVLTLIDNPDNLLKPVDGEMRIKVGNPAGAALPHTGSSGTALIYLLGLMLTGIAGAALVLRRRRRIA